MLVVLFQCSLILLSFFTEYRREAEAKKAGKTTVAPLPAAVARKAGTSASETAQPQNSVGLKTTARAETESDAEDARMVVAEEDDTEGYDSAFGEDEVEGEGDDVEEDEGSIHSEEEEIEDAGLQEGDIDDGSGED